MAILNFKTFQRIMRINNAHSIVNQNQDCVFFSLPSETGPVSRNGIYSLVAEKMSDLR